MLFGDFITMDSSSTQTVRHCTRWIGGILLVTGTATGAGMLALPVISGMAGFYPSLVLFAAYWIYMTYTALLMLEVNLWMPEGTNLITMAKNTLGRTGEVVSWITYLFLLYTLTTAYIAGGGPIFIDFVHATTGLAIPQYFGSIPLLAIFGYFVYKGTKHVDYINRILMFGLVCAYLIMVTMLTPFVETKLLVHVEWKYIFAAVSVVATSFGFHIIIPTLTTYLRRDVVQLRRVIWIGSFIPLVVYIVWEWLALGIIPIEGPYGITSGYVAGSNGVALITNIIGNTSISLVAKFFSFFAIITSFLGVSLSLSHFLSDGLKIENSRKGRVFIFLLTFVPPLMFTMTDPRAFIDALEYAGAFGVVILLGFLPALMVWVGRYNQHRLSTYKVPGGKIALIATMVLSLGVMILEIINKLGMLPSIH